MLKKEKNGCKLWTLWGIGSLRENRTRCFVCTSNTHTEEERNNGRQNIISKVIRGKKYGPDNLSLFSLLLKEPQTLLRMSLCPSWVFFLLFLNESCRFWTRRPNELTASVHLQPDRPQSPCRFWKDHLTWMNSYSQRKTSFQMLIQYPYQRLRHMLTEISGKIEVRPLPHVIHLKKTDKLKCRTPFSFWNLARITCQ